MTSSEEPALETDYVTFDTSTVESFNFTFADSRVLRRLAYLAEHERIFVVLSDVVQHEIEAHIKEGVREALTRHKPLRKALKILNNSATSEFSAVFGKPQEGDLVGRLIKQFHDFLSSAKVEIVSAEKADLAEIMAKYFAGAAPFGKADKKAEFPDAVAISALRRWCEENDQTVYVISGDGDFKKVCEEDNRLLHLSTVNEFLNLVSATDQRSPSKHILTLVKRNTETISAAIAKEFEWLGFVLTDSEGDVVGVDVDDARLSKPTVIDIEGETAVVGIDAEVSFEAEVSYDDLDNALYDSSDGEHTVVVFDKIEDTVQQTETVHVQISVIFFVSDPAQFELTKVEIIGTTDINVRARDDGWPYK